MFERVMSAMALISICGLLSGCTGQEEERMLPDRSFVHEAFVESNIYLIDIEDEAIDDFVKRYGWEMQKSGSGLRYQVERTGRGAKASYGDRAEIRYAVYLITGDPVYSSEDLGNKVFTVGRGGIESGIEEGIRLMREGDQATFILPSYLAHGVPGDGDKIPRRASLVYKIELVKLF